MLLDSVIHLANYETWEFDYNGTALTLLLPFCGKHTLDGCVYRDEWPYLLSSERCPECEEIRSREEDKWLS